MAENRSSSPPSHLPTTTHQPGPRHTILPVEIWVNVFTRFSELPGQSLSPLAAVCRGWQYEIEKLTFSEIVVRTNEHDIAMLRRVMGDSHRAGCVSKITLSAQAGWAHAHEARDGRIPRKVTLLRIFEFIDCLGNSVRGRHQPSLTLGFRGFEDSYIPMYSLGDKIRLHQHLRGRTSSQYNIGRIVLSLEKNQLPADLIQFLVEFCSPELKSIDLALVATNRRDNYRAGYNSFFMGILQQALQQTTLDEVSITHPSSVHHQEEHPCMYRPMMVSLVSISENLQVFRADAIAADMFFDLSKNMQWPKLHTLEIVSLMLGGIAATCFQDDYLERAVALVTQVARAANRMKNLRRLDLQQLLWPYHDHIWDVVSWAWMKIEFNVHISQRTSEATVAELSIQGVEPDVEAIEAWNDAISKDRGIPLDCEVSRDRHQEIQEAEEP